MLILHIVRGHLIETLYLWKNSSELWLSVESAADVFTQVYLRPESALSDHRRSVLAGGQEERGAGARPQLQAPPPRRLVRLPVSLGGPESGVFRTPHLSFCGPPQQFYMPQFDNLTGERYLVADGHTDSTAAVNESSNGTLASLHARNAAVGVLLAAFCLVVIVGNIMVILAVSREIYLRTITNYFIVSLAVADVMVGGVVMPFSISLELSDEKWFFGPIWCDIWHSLDVLASTASILNLCVISLDRYWAITDPIAYPTKMNNTKVCMLIFLVWFCSAGISFPAIAWWNAVEPAGEPPGPDKCVFTENIVYLIVSSLISFYIPTFIMLFVYYKIYQAALEQSKGLRSGSKVTSNGLHGEGGEVMTLRIHRGGTKASSGEESTACERSTSDSDIDSPSHILRHKASSSEESHPRGAKFITKRLRNFAISRKLTKLAREQKAAKTLGIVVGVFIICWLPFFVMNVLMGICKTDCVKNADVIMPIFTWLGYLNSGMNPIIYALSMKDFRRAFGKMIVCCPKYRFYTQHRKKYTTQASVSTSSFSVTCGDRCVALRI